MKLTRKKKTQKNEKTLTKPGTSILSQHKLLQVNILWIMFINWGEELWNNILKINEISPLMSEVSLFFWLF